MTREPVPAARLPWRRALAIGVGVWLVYVATAGGSLGTGDAVAVYEQAKAMLDRGALDVPASQSLEAWRGADGRWYSPFGIFQSIVDLPFIVAGRALAGIGGGALARGEALPKAAVAMASTVAAAVAVAAAFLIAWLHGGRERGAALAAIAVAFGTPLWTYSKFGFNAPLAAALLAIGVAALAWCRRSATPRRAAIVGGFAFAAAALTRHELFLAAAVAIGWVVWQQRVLRRASRLLIDVALPIAIAVVIWGALNWTRFGHPLASGHRPAFDFGGWLGYAVSPSGALLLYAPVAVAAIGWLPALRARDDLATLVAAVTGVLVLFYAALEDWLGTRSYGPRYLVPLLPLLVAPLARWIEDERSSTQRRAAWVLVVVSVLVQLPAVAVDFTRAGIAAGQPPQAAREYAWRWSPQVVTTRAALTMVPANLGYVAGTAPIPQPAPSGGAESLGDRLSFSLDFWWLYLYYLGMWPIVIAVAAGAGPALAGVWILTRACRTASASD